jgi:hypothetical protein
MGQSFSALARVGAALVVVLLMVGASLVPQLPHPVAEAAGADYYPETGHTLSGPLRTYWNERGGLWLFGYPISQPYSAVSETGETVVAQYFERARLEYHPSLDGGDFRVLGGLLGNDLTTDRRDEVEFQRYSAPGIQQTGACDFFAETGHSMCDPFKTWWQNEGGLPIFGYPISQPFEEGGYLVQYYERARFEWHPEFAGTQWEVELGLLGRVDAQQRGMSGQPAFKRVNPQTTTARVDTSLTNAPWGEAIATVPAGTTVSIVGGPSQDEYQVTANGATGWVPFGDLNWSAAQDPRTANRESLDAYDADVSAYVASVNDSVSVGIYDPNSNQVYEGGGSGPVAGASLSKVLLVAIALKQSEANGGDLSEDMRPTLEVMIEMSDNDAANTIWGLIGGQAGVVSFLSDNNVDGFAVPDMWDWGQISATGGDWSIFLARLGNGQILSPADTAYALGLMHNVIGEHRWGVLTPGNDILSIGKNGWYLDDDPFEWRVNSAGFIDSSEGQVGVAPLVVTVMSCVPGEWGMDWGADAAAQVTQRVIAHAARDWSDTYLDTVTSATRAPASMSPAHSLASQHLQNR